jgi:DNA primase
VYYSKRVADLVIFPSGSGQGKCPLHDDDGAALQIQTHNGRWYCRFCGRGSMTEFHQRLMSFESWNDAVVDLIKEAAA